MSRFTILRHCVGLKFQRPLNSLGPRVAAGREHWDWLFEQSTMTKELAVGASNDGGNQTKGLWTWATDPLLDATRRSAAGEPSKRLPATVVPALRLPNHRELYLHFEGAISGERGHVHQIASGRYDVIRCQSGSFEAMLTITKTRWIDPTEVVSVHFCHSSDESNPTSSAWTLRTGNDPPMGTSSTIDATL